MNVINTSIQKVLFSNVCHTLCTDINNRADPTIWREEWQLQAPEGRRKNHDDKRKEMHIVRIEKC